MFLPFLFTSLVIINFQITLLSKISEVLIPFSEDNFVIYTTRFLRTPSETVEKPDFESSVLLRNPNFLVCSIG